MRRMPELTRQIAEYIKYINFNAGAPRVLPRGHSYSFTMVVGWLDGVLAAPVYNIGSKRRYRIQSTLVSGEGEHKTSIYMHAIKSNRLIILRFDIRDCET